MVLISGVNSRSFFISEKRRLWPEFISWQSPRRSVLYCLTTGRLHRYTEIFKFYLRSLGIENIIGGVIDVMKESTSIGSFKEDVEKLATDVASGLAIPPEQKDQVTSQIRKDIKETGTSSVNSKLFTENNCFIQLQF